MVPAGRGTQSHLPDDGAEPAAERPGVPTGEPLLELIAVMDRLRSPGGCPWDAEQTHESLVSYLTEEAHEAVEAIETGDRAAMREELGDVLLQVMFHARIAQEHPSDPWSVDDVAAGIVAKLVARHPHVFGDETADSAAHVESQWQARKAVEKARESVLDGIPSTLPALLLATKIHRRVSYGSVPAEPGEPAMRARAGRLLDEVGTDGVGPLLLALATAAADRGVDAEAALRRALRDHAEHVRAVESGST